jgi:hypothetical protein
MRYYVDFGKNYKQITTMKIDLPRYIIITGIIPMGIRHSAQTIIEHSKNGDLQWIKSKHKKLLDPLTQKEQAKLSMQILQSVDWNEIQRHN